LEYSERLTVRRSRVTNLLPNRIRGKALNSLIFVLRSSLHILKGRNRCDVLLVTTAPPFSLGLGWLANLLFGTPYVALMYDLYPDVAVELGVLTKYAWIARWWDAANRMIWRRAARIIVLSTSMKARLVAKCPDIADKIAIIHSWADPTQIVPIAKADNWFAQDHGLVEPFTVLYSGNMGRCHDMDTILQAAQLLREQPIKFVFIGDGAKRDLVMAQVEDLGLTNFLFLPYQEKENLTYSLTAGDLSLVSVSEGMEGLVAPSKLYSALATGRPIAAICERHSYLRGLIADAECGHCFANGDGAGLAQFIQQLADDRAYAQRLGMAGRRYLEANFTPERITQQYARTIRQAVLSHESLTGVLSPQQEVLV
jgi:glycosyltransferase involved in cell wall biosynthesis